MSAVYSAKDIRSYQQNTAGIETGSQSEAVEPTIVSVGDPMPDAELFNNLLEQEKLSSGFSMTRTRLAKQPENSPKIVLLNLKQLTLDAQEKIRIAKSKFHAPVICLIPIDDADKVGMIESLGADDFLFKPFNPKEFACRVKVLLRRFGQNDGLPSVERRSMARRSDDRKQLHDSTGMTCTRVKVDNDRKLVWFDNRKVELTPKEYALFSLLASEPERVFSSQEIIEHLWSDCKRATAANVQQYIYMLRKKIEPDIQNPQWLITIKGFGYRLDFANT